MLMPPPPPLRFAYFALLFSSKKSKRNQKIQLKVKADCAPEAVPITAI